MKWAAVEWEIVENVFEESDSDQDAPITVWSETLQSRLA